MNAGQLWKAVCAMGFTMSDIAWQKKASIERCIKQARRYYAMPSDKSFAEDYLRQDAVVMNLQSACEQCINMANYVIRIKKLGLPTTSAESFTLLCRAGLIDDALEEVMKNMIGFRNTVVHRYQEINLNIVQVVVEKRCG